MKFSRITIQNFRNFKDISVNLSNKNVIFGMNDSGKSNFLYAIQFLLDGKKRYKGFVESDYHCNNTHIPISIVLMLDLSDRIFDSVFAEDSKKLIASVKESRTKSNLDIFYVKLIAEYDELNQIGNPVLFWGSELDKLVQIPQTGIRNQLDNLFKVVYLDPNIDLDKVFKANRKIIFESQTKDFSEEDRKFDEEKEKNISQNILEMNSNISELKKIIKTKKKLTDVYKKFRNEDLDIEIKSEVAISGYLDDLKPYIKWNNTDDNLYPTSGDGRKKLLSYALDQIISDQFSYKKILVYLIEEPENSLHRSLQTSLSKQLFSNELYNYFFMTTHSSELLYEMDQTQLIKISQKNNKLSASYYYEVPEEYSKLKLSLNKSLSNSIFYDKILLVEGGSEYQLFSAIFNYIQPDYEIKRKYIIQVDGVNFKPYVQLYDSLNIEWLLKTDNDLHKVQGEKSKFIPMGIRRAYEICKDKNLDNFNKSCINKIEIDADSGNRDFFIKDKKREIFQTYKNEINIFKKNNIYVSEIDLENDLCSELSSDFKYYIVKKNGEYQKKILSNDEFVTWLQDHKLLNMLEFIEYNITKEISEKLINAERFIILKEFLNDNQ